MQTGYEAQGFILLMTLLSGFPGAVGGVSVGSDACLLPRRSDIHASEDPQRDQRGPGPLDIWAAAGGAGKQAPGQGGRRGGSGNEANAWVGS